MRWRRTYVGLRRMSVRACDSRSPMRLTRPCWSSALDVAAGMRRRQVGHRRGVAAAVVVEDDDDPALAVAEVVQRLVGHAAGHRAVADHGDDVAVRVDAGVAGDGHAVGVGEDRRGVAVLDVVVAALLARRVAGQPAGLAQLGEPGLRAR